MTREEAKHIVDVAFSVPQAIRRAGEDRTYYQDEISEAKNMAIQALSQEPCTDAASREEEIKKLKEQPAKVYIDKNDYQRGYIDGVNQMVKELKAEQKSTECDDAISREAILSKIKEVCFSEEWVQFRINNGSNGQRDFLINYIEQLPLVIQKSCEDAISRYDTVNMMHIIMDGAYIGDNDEDSNCYESLNDIKEQYIEIVKGANSITPSRRKGHWEKINMQMFGIDYECSECKRRERKKSDFCPNCGAKMESEDKE